MNTILCKHCKKDVEFTTQKKANNYVAYCSECGSYIKNISHSDMGISKPDPEFPFGKYKGTKVFECNDLDYLEWCLNTLTLNDKFMDCVYYRLEELKNK